MPDASGMQMLCAKLTCACCAGPTHSTNWWLGACLSTIIPVIYSFTGGMRASVMTDMSQVRLLMSSKLLARTCGLAAGLFVRGPELSVKTHPKPQIAPEPLVLNPSMAAAGHHLHRAAGGTAGPAWPGRSGVFRHLERGRHLPAAGDGGHHVPGVRGRRAGRPEPDQGGVHLHQRQLRLPQCARLALAMLATRRTHCKLVPLGRRLSPSAGKQGRTSHG